jgi:hypothetical protein
MRNCARTGLGERQPRIQCCPIVNYALPIAAAFLALLMLAKDWDAHRTSWRRVAVLGLIIATGIGGAINNHYTKKKSDAQHQLDQNQIAGLQKAIDTANKNQQDNTEQFVDAFGKLFQKVSDLQTQVKTADLRKQAARS